jgi:hypothetical protein
MTAAPELPAAAPDRPAKDPARSPSPAGAAALTGRGHPPAQKAHTAP